MRSRGNVDSREPERQNWSMVKPNRGVADIPRKRLHGKQTSSCVATDSLNIARPLR